MLILWKLYKKKKGKKWSPTFSIRQQQKPPNPSPATMYTPADLSNIVNKLAGKISAAETTKKSLPMCVISNVNYIFVYVTLKTKDDDFAFGNDVWIYEYITPRKWECIFASVCLSVVVAAESEWESINVELI